MTISEFAAEKVAVAKDFRGLARVNPVEFQLEYNGKIFILLCSEIEPDTVTVPFNVLWINTDESHPDYLVVMRRVDAEPYDDGGYRGAWSIISSVEELYTEDQYFKTDSDPIVGEVVEYRPRYASDILLGGFYTTHDRQIDTDAGDRIVIGSNDPRMSDARDPIDHNHADIPRTMFAANDDAIVYISNNDPQIGDILVVTAEDEAGNYHATWVSPSMEFPYLGPVPVSISVVGPMVPVNGDTGHVLRADVTMSDNEILRNVYATWTVDNTEAASIGLNTGVFRANSVEFDTLVTVTVKWTHVDSGVEVETQFEILILGASGSVSLSSISIDGPANFSKKATATYTVVASYSDGSNAVVTPVSFTSSNANAGSFVDGVLTPLPDQMGNVTTILSASYTENGITRNTSRSITVIDATVYPNSIEISGPAQINTGATGQFTAVVVNSDGSKIPYTGTWNITGNATVDQNGLVTGSVITTPGNKTATLSLSYTAEGVTVTRTRQITIVDTNVWPVSGVITGSSSVQSEGTAQYTYTVTYSDGSEKVKIPTWRVTGAATINSSGILTANTVTSDSSATVTATYTEAGINLNAQRIVAITAPGEIDVPPARLGVAQFANRNFTGGVIVSEITQEELDYGVSLTEGLFGLAYKYWDGFEDFVEKEMTVSLNIDAVDHNATWTGSVASDYYVYLMWDARAGDIEIKNQMGFISTWTGVNHRTPQLGNEEGLPGYDPNLPSVREIMFDDGTGARLWKVIKLETTPLPEVSPVTLTYTFKYV